MVNESRPVLKGGWFALVPFHAVRGVLHRGLLRLLFPPVCVCVCVCVSRCAALSGITHRFILVLECESRPGSDGSPQISHPRFCVGGQRATLDPRNVSITELLPLASSKVDLPTGWEKVHQLIYGACAPPNSNSSVVHPPLTSSSSSSFYSSSFAAFFCPSPQSYNKTRTSTGGSTGRRGRGSRWSRRTSSGRAETAPVPTCGGACG